MAYADEIIKEGVASNYLIVITPRRQLRPFTVDFETSLIYEIFTLGEIVKYEVAGVEQTKASSKANVTVDGTWFYDIDEQRLYADPGLSLTNENSIIYYEIRLGTYDAYWYRDPLDDSTRVVYYEPLIVSSPSIQANTSDDLFGFLPIFSSSITVSNATNFLTEHIYESSFNLAEVKIYHYLSELTLENIKLVFDGFSKNVRYGDKATRIEIFDNSSLFDNDFRHVSGKNFYGSSFLSGLDPDFEGRPIRKVFGRVDRLIPVNIDFEPDSPTTSNNRIHIAMNPDDNLVDIEHNVSSSPTSTTTRTFLDDVSGLTVGDAVWIDKTTDEYVLLTDVVVLSSPAGYVDHEALVSGVAASGDTVKRGFIGNVYIYRQNFPVLALKYQQDYTIYTDATNKISGFTLANNFEANYNGAGQMFENAGVNPTSLITSDLIYCRVYGPTATSDDTIDGSEFGSTIFPLDNSLQITYSLLKRFLGIPESKIDTDAFEDLFASGTGSAVVGFAIPSQGRAQDFGSYKDILTDIFASVLIKFFINDSSQYSITVTDVLNNTPSKTIGDDEILQNTFNYTFDYKDIISDVFVNYNRKEVSAKFLETISFDTVSATTSETAIYLHKNPKQRTFDSVLTLQSEAQTLADRLSFALGDRKGRISFSTKNRFFDTQINETQRVSRDRLPGFAYVNGTDRTLDGAVLSINKTLTVVDIELDDQKGIEDNSGDW